MRKKFLFNLFFFFLFLLPVSAQSGGIFEIKQAVISPGGEVSANGGTAVDGTVGQTAAGESMNGGIFSVESGIWSFVPLAPTAANASISGRILTAQGGGIRNAVISLTAVSGGEVRSSLSSSFGYFRFENVPIGETYILTVQSKNFVFLPNSRVVMLLDDLTDVNFTAEPDK